MSERSTTEIIDSLKQKQKEKLKRAYKVRRKKTVDSDPCPCTHAEFLKGNTAPVQCVFYNDCLSFSLSCKRYDWWVNAGVQRANKPLLEEDSDEH